MTVLATGFILLSPLYIVLMMVSHAGKAAGGLEGILCGELVKELQESMDMCTDRRDIGEIPLKTALNTIQLLVINQSWDCPLISVYMYSYILVMLSQKGIYGSPGNTTPSKSIHNFYGSPGNTTPSKSIQNFYIHTVHFVQVYQMQKDSTQVSLRNPRRLTRSILFAVTSISLFTAHKSGFAPK